ncbi:MAG: site-2 protease family protein [Candidatus Hydrothermarchaeales archaeon]
MVSVVLIVLFVLWILLQLIDPKTFEKLGVERGLLTLIFRSKRGIEAIDRTAKKRENFFRRLGTIAAYISVPLMLLVFISLFLSASHILKTPDAPPGVAPLLPEGLVEIEGAPSIPLFYWLIAVISLLIVHELMHGLLARVEGIPIKSLGIFSVTFIPLGAFVEPDEEVLEKKSPMAKMRVYAAGSMGNFIGAAFAGLLFLIVLMVVAPLAFTTQGIVIQNVTSGSPAALAGISVNQTLLGIGTVDIKSIGDFREAVTQLEPETPISVSTSAGTYNIVPAGREGYTQGFIGIAVGADVAAKPYIAGTVGEKRAFSIYGVVVEGLYWVAILNFLVGLTNLLPIIPLDGGRMFALLMEQAAPKSHKNITTVIYLVLLVLVVINAGPLFGLF